MTVKVIKGDCVALNIRGLVSHMEGSVESITAALKKCIHYVPNIKKTQHFLSSDYQLELGQTKIVMGKSLREKGLTKCLECHFLSRKGMSVEEIEYLDTRKYYSFIFDLKITVS